MATPSWSTDFPSSLPIGQIFNSYIDERYFVNKSTNTLAVPPCLMELPLETASDDTGWVKRRKNAYFWPIKRRKRNIGGLSETMKDKHKVTIENYQELACTRASFRVVSILWRWMTSHWTIIAHPWTNVGALRSHFRENEGHFCRFCQLTTLCTKCEVLRFWENTWYFSNFNPKSHIAFFLIHRTWKSIKGSDL